MKRIVIVAAGAVLTVAAAWGLHRADQVARVASAYKAKTLCSEIFLAGREATEVESRDFADMHPAVAGARSRVDAAERRVDASIFGFGRTRASYRDGYGCTIEADGAPQTLPTLPSLESSPWPESLPQSPLLLRRIDYAAMQAAVDKAFADEAAGHRALVVVVDGRIVAENYAEGFSASIPFLSWSAAKSVTATIAGAAAARDLIDLEAPAPVPEWKGDAKRSAVTWNDLLRMQSGLAFAEHYDDPTADVNRMLFRARDAGAVAARKKLAHEPGAVWYYSSGTSNLLARTLRGVLSEKGIDYQTFARESIFGPIGASSVTMETDSEGNPLGSSFVYATARDWAKLGQLYAQRGAWNGNQILPEQWSDYVSAPTQASNGEYGAHFWLNRDGEGRNRFIPGLPQDVYYMAGHEGQYVVVVPDKNAVIVRLGMTRGAVPIEIASPVFADIYNAIDDLPELEAASYDL